MRFHMISINGGTSELIGETDDGKLYQLDALYRRAADSAVTIRANTVSIDALLQSNDPVAAATWLFNRLDETPEVDPDAELTWDVPIRGGDIICVGRNYVAHAEELGNAVPGEPILFMKPRASLLNHGGVIEVPESSSRVDFEGELALVIGQTVRGEISDGEARQALVGVTLLNDVTDRAWQKKLKEAGKPWFAAKGRSTFCPLGPSIRFLERKESLADYSIETRLNGKVRQQGHPGLWLFSAITLVQYIARHIGLRPGDIIATGTPEGVGALEARDKIELHSPKIGTLRNTVQKVVSAQ
ncbi:fumarylacetoacetate hydrolase family protein [bacterium]|nr:fumarylacetoacetate hydrolase family protein [bacterium]